MTGAPSILDPIRILLLTIVILITLSPAARAEIGEPSSDHPQPALTPMSATYSAAMEKGLSLDGTATRTLEQQADGTWLYRFDVESFIADITESVTFRWQDGRVRPLKYRYKLKGVMLRDRSRALDFNWQAGKISGSFEGDGFSMTMAENAIDPLGFQLQMRQDLKSGKETMTYAVADEGDFDRDRFAVIGRETQSTPFGVLEAVKVEKVRDSDSKRQTLMWFAPELDYLLVRLVQVEPDGSRYEVNLEDTSIRTPE